jgi:DNA-binding PadR family transcriptional regulator
MMKIERELLKGAAPLAVLQLLSAGPMYGYELAKALNDRSEGILALGKGTLYPLLYNLEAKKFVKAKWEEGDTGRPRRYYTLTGKGKKELARKREQWDRLQQGMGLVLGAPNAAPSTAS